jgi:hypothetical protein
MKQKTTTETPVPSKDYASTVFGPLILSSDLVLFLWREVVLDVKCFPNFLRGLALDHICDSLAADI